MYSTTDVDMAVKLLTDKIASALDKFAPVKTIQVRPTYAPWLTEEAKELMNQRDLAQLIASQSQSQDSWRHYRQLRNLATKCLKNAKKGGSPFNLTSSATMQQICGGM